METGCGWVVGYPYLFFNRAVEQLRDRLRNTKVRVVHGDKSVRLALVALVASVARSIDGWII